MFEVRSFLGLAGYYRRFVEGFSKIVGPITRLLHKNEKFTRTEKCEQSFEELKKSFVSALVLTLPTANKEFVVYCDASIQDLGFVLVQEDRVMAYASRQLRSHE